MALNLIRKNNSDAVYSYHDAAMFYAMLGDGILNNVFNSMNVYRDDLDRVVIQSGIACVCGRLVEVEENTTEVLTGISTYGENTFYIYLRLHIYEDDSTSTAEFYTSETLISNSTRFIGKSGGTYQVLFATVTISAATRSLTRLNPGIAKNALNLLSGGLIGGAKFENIFLSDMSGVRYAKRANVCAEARGFVGGNKNRVQANLYMPGRGVFLMQEAVLVETTSDIELAAGSSTTLDFQNSASLSSLSGVVKVEVETDGLYGFGIIPDNAASVVQYDYVAHTATEQTLHSTRYEDAIKLTIDITNKQVKLANTGTTSALFNPFKLKVQIYGGAV